ncbi:polyketide biosynthesis enoyl-CoA hydratase PksH [Allocatelliglobosispora scoriae]|uniref:Polyketide biosynthesis enoyl-CoA hydratase PksH n=1 Tax=Allocatelliglobosispora scoriae TaxID=643052 RepID=A0A841BLY4_9ACTN|nr:enoyl-CoA hydratase-related protein [Allocatelliglobosispora scoriae]MBB5867762.1 polyketide biosynthesis enoyl-CoA hydratase PksH [Allocatelliglobosispora scoriae]
MTAADTSIVDSVRGPHWHTARLRGDGRHFLDGAAAAALLSALDAAEADPRCRAFAVTADGEWFCSGLRLPDRPGTPDWLDSADPVPLAVFARLASSPLVTVAAVQGRATGGGVGLAAACDLVIAARTARFRLTEAIVGLTPKAIGPHLVRRLGAHRTYLLALLAWDIDAVQAAALGLADLVADDLGTAVRRQLTVLRHIDPHAVAELKRDRATGTGEESAQAATALRARFADPGVIDRISALRDAGALS